MLDNKLPGRKPFVHCDGDHDLQARRKLTQVSREAVDSDASSAARVAVSYQLMFTRPQWRRTMLLGREQYYADRFESRSTIVDLL